MSRVNAYVDLHADAIADVLIERAKQDQQWGGPATDDQRDIAEWAEYIHKQISHMFTEQKDNRAIRQRFVKVAALALAAIASMDRVLVPEVVGCGECAVCRMEKFIKDIETHNAGQPVLFEGNVLELLAMLGNIGGPRQR